jgi:hypothetical protein
VSEPLLAGDPASAEALLSQFAADPDLPDDLRPFLKPLLAISAEATATTPWPTPRGWTSACPPSCCS